MKSESQDYDDSVMYLDSSSQAYLRKLGDNRYAGLSDIGIFYISRFIELFGFFKVNIPGIINENQTLQKIERYNNSLAEKKGIQLGFYAYPFIFSPFILYLAPGGPDIRHRPPADHGAQEW